MQKKRSTCTFYTLLRGKPNLYFLKAFLKAYLKAYLKAFLLMIISDPIRGITNQLGFIALLRYKNIFVRVLLSCPFDMDKKKT